MTVRVDIPDRLAPMIHDYLESGLDSWEHVDCDDKPARDARCDRCALKWWLKNELYPLAASARARSRQFHQFYTPAQTLARGARYVQKKKRAPRSGRWGK